MKSEEFIEKVVFLFGDSWSYEISKRLALNIRTVKRMGSGKKEIPNAVAAIIDFWIGAYDEK